MAALKLALEEKTKEVMALQKDLNLLLSTMTKAQSSGPVQLGRIDLSVSDHGSALEGLVVQSQTQVCYYTVYLFVCMSVHIVCITVDLIRGEIHKNLSKYCEV